MHRRFVEAPSYWASSSVILKDPGYRLDTDQGSVQQQHDHRAEADQKLWRARPALPCDRHRRDMDDGPTCFVLPAACSSMCYCTLSWLRGAFPGRALASNRAAPVYKNRQTALAPCLARRRTSNNHVGCTFQEGFCQVGGRSILRSSSLPRRNLACRKGNTRFCQAHSMFGVTHTRQCRDHI